MTLASEINLDLEQTQQNVDLDLDQNLFNTMVSLLI